MGNESFGHRIGLLLVFLAGVVVAAKAQQPEETPHARPKIGLVFEGGGALGFAHIGALEWLEAHHIPVDYVAGTSMGGLVGGLYSAGNSPAEITEFVGDIDWATVLSGQVPFPRLSLRRKEDRLAFPNRLEFGLKHGFSLPNGLNSGSAVNLLFDHQLLAYWDLKSFDDLPIPFRCVATDLATGQPHVFENGSLPRALRATMSIPGLFAPVTIDGHIYADGGAVDNFPVDVVKQMGAQVVIGIYLDTGPFNPASVQSLFGVAGRNAEIMTAANEAKNIKDTNILIRADVSKFTVLEFSRSKEIIPVGVAAAQAQAAALEKYSLNDADWEAYLAQRRARRRTKVPVPQFVEVSGLKGMQQSEVRSEFKKYINKPIDTKKLDESIADLEGTGTYSAINYSIVDEKDKPGLLVRPLTKNYGPPFLNLGVTLAANNSNAVYFGFQARATFMNLVGPGSEVRVDGSVGQLAGGAVELYKPVFLGKPLFIAPHGYFAHGISAYYEGDQQLAQYKETKNGLGFDFAYQFNSKTEVRIGEDYQWFKEALTIGQPIEQAFSLTPFVSKFQFQYFGQNEVMVPTQGTLVQTLYNYFTQRPNGTGGYSQMTFRAAHFIPFKDRNVIFGMLQGGTSFGADNLGLAGFQLGGPLRLSSYNQGQLLGTNFFLIQPGYLYRLARLNPVIGGDIYAGGVYEIGKITGGNLSTPNLPNDVAGVLIVKTLLGPLYGGYAVGTGWTHKWYFGLGRIF